MKVKFLIVPLTLAVNWSCGSNDELNADPTTDPSTTSAVSTPDASTSSTDGEASETDAILAVKAYVDRELKKLHQAAVDLQEAAPEPDDDGWNADDDEAGVEAMRDAWRDARASYERVEGAIAVLFPNYDASTDERYDGFIEEGPDDNLFDGEGVTGVHAIERILWANEHPAHVVAFESALPNYEPAAFPGTEQQATDFRDSLVQRLVDDTQAMVDQFKPLALDAPSAFRGVIGSLEEQLEKVGLAATGEDESRYAQHTLGDMRENLVGGRDIFEAFVPWLNTVDDGEQLSEDILAAFDDVEAYYAALPGDAIPAVPADWNPDDPAADDLDTDYGQLHTFLSEQADPDVDGSLVSLMLVAADALGISQLPD